MQECELRQVGVHAIHDCEWSGEAGIGIFAVHLVGDAGNCKAVTLTMDLNGSETPEQLLERIFKEANVKKEDIVRVWASPPCETFSCANASNIGRGHHYRLMHADYKPVQGEKGETARQHD